MGEDHFQRSPRGVSNPAERSYAITPNDSTDMAESCRALYVGTAGDVAMMLVGDAAAVTFVGIQAGSLLPFRIKRVLVTGTTASNLVGVY